MPSCLKTARLAPLALAFAASAAFAVTPTVTLSPAGNHPQGTTQVSGTGFGANEGVDIYFDTADEMLVVTDSSGKFTARTLGIPAGAQPGTHWISAIGRKDGAAAQRAFLVRTRWSSYGFNERGRHDNPYENTIYPYNVSSLDLAWSGLTGGDIVSSPAVAQIASTYNPYVFVGSADGQLYAFDSTGALVWKKATGGAIFSSPAVSGSTVFVGSYDGTLNAFKAANGAPAWPAPATTGGAIESSPVVANGIVYVGSNDGKLYAFHASDGTAAWASPPVVGTVGYASPAVADGIVYIGSGSGSMYAFDAATGAAAWTSPFTTGALINSQPAVAGDVLYFGSQDDKIYAVNAKSGAPKWSVTTGNVVFSGAAVANGVVYIGSNDAKLYALRASDGAVLWTGTLGNSAGPSSATVANGVVYIGGWANDLKAFSANGCGAATCSPLWTASAADYVFSSPAISDGMLYFGSDDNRLYAYALNGGNNAAYKLRKATPPPSYASLHPDMRLRRVHH